MHKINYLLFLLLFYTLVISGQNSSDKQSNFFDNVRFGGSVNMGFGNSHSFFAIAPSAIYDFSEYFSTGLSLQYMYLKNKSPVQKTTNLYGASVLALFRPVNSIQLSAEYEQLKLNDKIVFQEAISLWQPALYIGAEYVTGNLAMGLRYDLLYKKTNIIYASAVSPVFRVYF